MQETFVKNVLIKVKKSKSDSHAYIFHALASLCSASVMLRLKFNVVLGKLLNSL